jgi:hypothetical protein
MPVNKKEAFSKRLCKFEINVPPPLIQSQSCINEQVIEQRIDVGGLNYVTIRCLVE